MRHSRHLTNEWGSCIRDGDGKNDVFTLTSRAGWLGKQRYGITWGWVTHARLSIIDLETGKQPICNEDGTVWITYNGEIYNYRELRLQLEGKGHQFHTKSDTEVIVHSYEEWGDQCVERFRGMFAFGIADLKQQRVFLARDQLGIKPLYYLRTASCFAFASEIQALRCIPHLDLSIDIQGLDQYLWLQYIPAPKTIFKEISKLPPAHYLTVTFDGDCSRAEEYWRIRFSPVRRRSEGEWLEMIEEVVRDSVKTHLVSDVPFGAFLSGGVDSSAVVAYMSRTMTEPVKTFSIGFEEDEFSEIDYAEVVAKKWGTEHHVEIVKPDALEVLPRLVKHYGEPFGDSSALPTYYVCQMARKHVPMVLSPGDGPRRGVCRISFVSDMDGEPFRQSYTLMEEHSVFNRSHGWFQEASFAAAKTVGQVAGVYQLYSVFLADRTMARGISFGNRPPPCRIRERVRPYKPIWEY